MNTLFLNCIGVKADLGIVIQSSRSMALTSPDLYAMEY